MQQFIVGDVLSFHIGIRNDAGDVFSQLRMAVAVKSNSKLVYLGTKEQNACNGG